MMEPYRNSIEHLCDEMARLDLFLRRALLVARQPDTGIGAEDFRGLIISESEIEQMLQARSFFGQHWRREQAKADELTPFDIELRRLREQIDARRRLSDLAGIELSLPWLAQQFNLSPAEVDILLIALAPELEPDYETLYAYLQNDVTRKRPSVNLALNLICCCEEEKLSARNIFAPSATLLTHRLIDLIEEPHDRQPSLLRKFLKMDESIVRFLLEQPPSVTGPGTLIDTNATREPLEIDEVTRVQLESLSSALKGTCGKGSVVCLIGQSNTALREAARRLCSELGYGVLIANRAQLENDEARIAALVRDATLYRAALAIIHDEPSEQEASTQRSGQTEEGLWRQFWRFQNPLLLLGSSAILSHVPPGAQLWRVDVAAPGVVLRRRAWEESLNGYEADSAYLADVFHFGESQIRQTINLASNLAMLRDPGQAGPSTQDILAAGRALTTPHLGRFAVQIEPRYTWPDLVLPPEKKRQLRGIAAQMKFRYRVYREWGFGKKLSRGKGLTVLFTGPSGTGKTMAAEVLADELSLDLFQIDLSSVVSKYIGETEKHLAAIFREAEQSQALLLFDEADALFGKRTEVKDAHDRYANIEVNYLLQRIESYEGVVILSTNLQRNLDDAFLRRMQDVVEFPFPNSEWREQIWRKHFPAEVPLADDIDFAFLGEQFKVAGGNIKNIVLHAAFLAAQESCAINMSHLILGTKAEFQKQGKLCVKADFGPYFGLISQRD